MNERSSAAHLSTMSNQTEPDFNDRQWRIVNFAVRKSVRWEKADFDDRIVILSRPGSDRTLALYPAGRTGRGVKVGLIDPSLPPARGLRWITQRDAWSMLAEGTL